MVSLAWVVAHQSSGVQRLIRERSSCGWKKKKLLDPRHISQGKVHSKFSLSEH